MMAEANASVTDGPAAVPFKAEVKQLLHILAHALYSDREIFLRELLSNASDAIHRLQFEMLTNRDVLDAEAEPAISVTGDEAAKTITIEDNGIGMTAEEMSEHLGTIAQSSARALVEQLEAGQRGNIIGQFGVGFYSAFVVADEVTVISRSHRPEAQAAQWQSRGDDTFTVGPAERANRGTTIILKLKEDAAEFATTWRLRQIIKRHSDFVPFPIRIGEEIVNQQTALWRQPAREVTEEQYHEFYRQLTYDFEPPLLSVHLSTDAPVDLHTILYIPSRRERGLMARQIEGTIRLYSRKILIQEEAKDLLPGHFRFVEGVVDSEDLPLNVARETVQSNPMLQRIKTTLTGRLTRSLNELAEKEPEKYARVWQEFGVFFKEGIAADPAARTDLLPLLRFQTSTADEALVSLAEYKGRMAEGQSEIYYVLAGDVASARQSPHLDPLRERNLEVLLLGEVIDGYMLNGLREFEGHKLRNIDDPDLELPGASAAPEPLVDESAFVGLIDHFKSVLGERISGVRASNLLRSSPARLVAAEKTPNREMERIQRMLNQEYQATPRLVELNRGHRLIGDLARLIQQQPDDPLIPALIEQIYDSALLLEGLHPNPATMVSRIQTLMEAAARPSGEMTVQHDHPGDPPTQP